MVYSHTTLRIGRKELVKSMFLLLLRFYIHARLFWRNMPVIVQVPDRTVEFVADTKGRHFAGLTCATTATVPCVLRRSFQLKYDTSRTPMRAEPVINICCHTDELEL